MSVQMVENWTEISGVVCLVDLCSPVKDFAKVEVDVATVQNIEGFANLLGHVAGRRLVVLMPHDVIAKHKIVEGCAIAARVRRAGLDRVFVHREHVHVR